MVASCGVTLRRARLVPGRATILRGVCTILVCNQQTRGTQPCTHPSGVAESSTSFAGVKARMSALPGGR